ncbi:glucosamine-6-phosphate deaminase [Flavihumibacter cheonanensis]|uniref:glucosamine-6-phosphate deaminase n=1 Tax=Flavihumibacter cheonanensis TaxID=1442385 RepID=UPI001EF8DD1E|nr:glucosamine-6-phosphate deaminase [Flavihumibacter cheonanensis]MCG7754545.1 glucosamine-6-phosphate deaminase [Flavihumibacter cheonanensis]
MEVVVFDSREEMGLTAAKRVSQKIRELQQEKPVLRMMFAAAPSQLEFLKALIKEPINWQGIIAFHMDEYIGLPASHAASFRNFLNRYLFDLVPFREIHWINGEVEDPQQEADRYAALLAESPMDIICLGIGENTHLAFNDPHVADFQDPCLVKLVDLDPACRQQQVNDGCFETLEEVPALAITVSLPALYSGTYLFCMVPGKNKAQAVQHTMQEAISPVFPSTLLRKHPAVVLFLDRDSAALLPSHN